MLEHELMWKTAWWSSVLHSWIQTQSEERLVLWSKEVAWEKIMEMEDINNFHQDWEFISGVLNEN